MLLVSCLQLNLRALKPQEGIFMKKTILLLTLALTIPLAHSNQERGLITTDDIPNKKELQEERPTDFKGNPNDDDMQREEDMKVPNPDGAEMEKNSDVLNKDKTKIHD